MSNTNTNPYEAVVANIQQTALSPCTDNAVSVELTYQQALSIHLRSEQLIRESKRLGGLTPEKLAEQIEKCYAQRYGRSGASQKSK